jgi:hypothetical protein
MSRKDKQKDADEVAGKIVLAIDCHRASNAMSSLACLNTGVHCCPKQNVHRQTVTR